jgi:hypothetical protein
MPNGGTQGVSSHFLKYHTDLNVRIRALKVLPGAGKNPPDFMTLLNHAAPRTQEQRTTILDALNRAVARGDKLLTGAAKENLGQARMPNEVVIRACYGGIVDEGAGKRADVLCQKKR